MRVEEIAREHRDWLSEAPREREVYVRDQVSGALAVLFFTGSHCGLLTGVAFQFESSELCSMVLVDQQELRDRWEVVAAY